MDILMNSEKENDKKEEKPNLLAEKLFKTRTLSLFESVTAKTAQEIINGLLLLEADNNEKPIYLFVNSPGGEVTSGFAIYDVIRFIKPEVKIICTGLCASIATVILLAATKANRLTLPNTRFLIHQPLIGGVAGQVSDIEITANEIVKTRKHINKIIAAETGRDLEQVTLDTDRDYWLTASEALKYGLITKIIESRSEL